MSVTTASVTYTREDQRRAEGPRLKELSVQTSSYGSPLPVHFGRIRTSGSVIWATDLIERRTKSGGGKALERGCCDGDGQLAVPAIPWGTASTSAPARTRL